MTDLESKDLWIQARIDELMDDEEWLIAARAEWRENGFGFEETYIQAKAASKAQREHAKIEAVILNAQIDNLEIK